MPMACSPMGGLIAHTRKKKGLKKDLRKLGNLDERKWKAQTTTQDPAFSLKIQVYSYLVENSQKATLNFYFKSRYSVKPSKFSTSFAHDCSYSTVASCNIGKHFTRFSNFAVISNS